MYIYICMYVYMYMYIDVQTYGGYNNSLRRTYPTDGGKNPTAPGENDLCFDSPAWTNTSQCAKDFLEAGKPIPKPCFHVQNFGKSMILY